jgi:hypothetical protein
VGDVLLLATSGHWRGAAAAQGSASVTVFVDIPKLQQLIEEIERQEPEEVAAARRERDKRLTEAWKKPPRQQSALAILIQSDVPIKDVAEALHRQFEPQRQGKPGGRHQRWRLPHYIVAYLVERSERSPCTERSRDELITHWINVINGWAFMRGKPPLDPVVGERDHERVKTLRRGSKRRRL